MLTELQIENITHALGLNYKRKPKFRKWAKRQYNKLMRRFSKKGEEPQKRKYRGYET